jgi:hypothetical protein
VYFSFVQCGIEFLQRIFFRNRLRIAAGRRWSADHSFINIAAHCGTGRHVRLVQLLFVTPSSTGLLEKLLFALLVKFLSYYRTEGSRSWSQEPATDRLLPIRKITGKKISYVNRLTWLRFSWFYPVPPGKCLYSNLNQATTASSTFLPIHHSLIILNLTLYSLSYRKRR